jgi:hypothetical protein
MLSVDRTAHTQEIDVAIIKAILEPDAPRSGTAELAEALSITPHGGSNTAQKLRKICGWSNNALQNPMHLTRLFARSLKRGQRYPTPSAAPY